VITYDAIVVGGGPAGSTCACFLVAGGRRVAVLDRARFPRVKLCAGWLSPAVWRLLELSPGDYPHPLWQWRRCHVHFAGRRHTVRGRGYFIRRYDFDDFLLRRSGATLIEGHLVRQIRRDRDGCWVVDGVARAPYLIGAGGTGCPVARQVIRHRPRALVVTQELEFAAPPGAVAAGRRDGEPELLLHDDLGGYSWCVPKSGWVNVGCGTLAAPALKPAWRRARAFFAERGHLPPLPPGAAGKIRGHAYHRFDPAHLDACHRQGAFLVGDALGLAQPVTAEGILPAVLSGRLCAEAILAQGDPGRYRRRLQQHPVLTEYQALLAILAAGRRLALPGRTAPGGRLLGALLARAFARSFCGRRLPASRAISLLARAR